MKIDIWSDIACPFCYIGTTQLYRAIDRFEHGKQVEVTHHSYQLNPEAPTTTDKTSKELLAAKFGVSEAQVDVMHVRTSAMFEEVGLTMNPDAVVPVNTKLGHELVHFAHSKGKQHEMMDRLFKAYFTDGISVSDIDALVQLAQEVGLDGEAARAALESHEFSTAVEADIRQARDFGIQGVPYFIVNNKYTFSGAQGEEVFLKALEDLWDRE